MAKKETVEKSLKKSRELEGKQEPITDIKKDDDWFKQQAEKLVKLLSKFPIKSKVKKSRELKKKK